MLTLPHELNPLILCKEENKRGILDLLFRAVAETLLERCRTLLGIAKPAPIAAKTTAEWIMQMIGIDVTRCPKCGSALLERTEVPPVRVLCFKPAPAGKDTS